MFDKSGVLPVATRTRRYEKSPFPYLTSRSISEQSILNLWSGYYLLNVGTVKHGFAAPVDYRIGASSRTNDLNYLVHC